MPIITKLGFQKNQKRVNVHLDGTFAFGLATTVALKNSLKKGQKLSERAIKRLLTSSWQEDLYEQAIQFLGIRPRSRKEVVDYAKRRLSRLRGRQKLPVFEWKEVFEDVKRTLIDKTIARLEENGLLDDEAFSRWFVQQRMRLKPKGKKALDLELRRKGVDRQILQAVLADETLYSPNQERAAAYQVAQKALRQLKGLIKGQNEGQITLKRRLYQRLASRGFTYDVVKTVVDDLLAKE